MRVFLLNSTAPLTCKRTRNDDYVEVCEVVNVAKIIALCNFTLPWFALLRLGPSSPWMAMLRIIYTKTS